MAGGTQTRAKLKLITLTNQNNCHAVSSISLILSPRLYIAEHRFSFLFFSSLSLALFYPEPIFIFWNVIKAERGLQKKKKKNLQI